MHNPSFRIKLPIYSVLSIALFFYILSIPVYSGNSPAETQQQAIQRIDRYIDHFRRTGDRTSLLGELKQAERELIASYDGFINSGDLASAALCMIKSGDVLRMQDQWPQAIDRYQKAFDHAKEADHPAYQAKALMGRARAEMYGLRDFGAAKVDLSKAVQLSSSVQDKSYLFDALDYMAQVQIMRGDLIGAADTLNRAFSAAGKIDDKTRFFYGHMDRADVYQRLAEKCDYQRTFEPCYEALELAKADYQKALGIAGELEYHGLVKAMEGFLRRLEMRRSLIQSQERAHKLLVQKGLFHPKRPDDVVVHERFIIGGRTLPAGFIQLIQQEGGFTGAGDARSFYIQGLFHEMEAESDAALAAYLKAVELLEVDRRRLRDEKSRGSFLEDKIEFYYPPILHLLERRRFAEAFELLERSRSRALADLLETKRLEISGSTDRDLLAESLRLKVDIALLQKDLFGLRSQADRDKYFNEITHLEQKIEGLENQHRQLQTRMARQAPKLLDLLVSKPVSLNHLQQSMKSEDYEILYYLLQESAVIIWHISSAAVQVRSVFLPRSELMKKVAALRKSVADSQMTFDQQTSRELFLFLVQPMLKWIRTNHLVIIPHEDLNYIPFQILQDPADSRYLGERFRITYAPSASILMGLKKMPNIAQGNLLAVADPGIPEAQTEVEAISRFYPGRHKLVKEVLITESRLKALAADYSLHHYSVHGRFNPGEPLLSYLKLRKDSRDDGKLTAAEMFGLNLDQAQLVVLSACETGQAEATHANEILGMVRALLYAGADNLILSSWSVDAASTAQWMETFYREAQRQPLSEAARLALVAVKVNPQFQHPYFWGPFLMIGK